MFLYVFTKVKLWNILQTHSCFRFIDACYSWVMFPLNVRLSRGVIYSNSHHEWPSTGSKEHIYARDNWNLIKDACTFKHSAIVSARRSRCCVVQGCVVGAGSGWCDSGDFGGQRGWVWVTGAGTIHCLAISPFFRMICRCQGASLVSS